MLDPTVQLFQQALALHRAGQLAQAELRYRQVLAINANHPGALDGLGVIACEAGQHQAGIGLIQRAISADPALPDYHHHLGQALAELGHYDQAISAYEQRVRLQPSSAAWTDLGMTLRQAHHLPQALKACRTAVQLDPNSANARRILADVLDELNELQSAAEEYQISIRLNPEVPEVRSALASVYKKQADTTRAIQTSLEAADVAARVRTPEQVSRHLSDVLLLMHYDPACEPSTILSVHERWNRALAHIPRRTAHPNNRSEHRRLRIGYVSPDFNGHPVGRFMLPVLAHHNHDQFEVVCYSDATYRDATTDRLKSHADIWRETAGISHEDFARQVEADQIDLLVDLTLHTKGNRLPAFARKPAPVQITYLAYAGTSGMSTMDWRLTDPYLDPPGDARFYSEKSLWLANSYFCYQPPSEAPIVAPLPALSGGGVMFACLNNYLKFSGPALKTWARILQGVRDSRLLLLADSDSQRQRVYSIFQEHNIAPGRIEFVARQPLEQFLQSHNRIDVALDPFPFNGGTTSCDALWMGVPFITLRGRHAVGRAGASLLSNIGLSQLIADTEDHYVELATELAADLPRLAALRQSLRQQMLASPLCDAAEHTRDIERLYRVAWKSWCTQAASG